MDASASPVSTTARAEELQHLLRALEELVIPFVAAGDASKLNTGNRDSESKSTSHSAVPSPNGVPDHHGSDQTDSRPDADGPYDLPKHDADGRTTRPLVDQRTPAELSAITDLRIPGQRLGLDRLVKQIEQVLRYSVNTWDQGFMDKLYSATNPVGVIAETLLAVLNTNVHVYSVSPMLTLIERAVTRLLAELVGFPSSAGGVAQPGGSASNQTSVVIARNTLYPETKAKGNGSSRFRLFTSAHGHYSVEKAAQMFGFGSEAVVTVPVDNDGRMIPAELENLVVASTERGETPFYVNATAGTTVYGAYDPFTKISEICKRHNLWMHIDGSWGGGVVFSKTLRQRRMRGAELADSIALTPHKMLSVPLTSSFLILSDLRKAWAAMRLEAGYLFHSDFDDNSSAPLEIYDLGQLTPQCGRRGDALKLFLSLQYYGLDYYETAIDAAFARVERLYTALASNDNFIVVTPSAPECLQVCFYYHPEDAPVASEIMSARTSAMAADLAARGWMTDYAPGERGHFFRVVCNINLRDDSIDQFVQAVEQVGAQLVSRTKTDCGR